MHQSGSSSSLWFKERDVFGGLSNLSPLGSKQLPLSEKPQKLWRSVWQILVYSLANSKSSSHSIEVLDNPNHTKMQNTSVFLNYRGLRQQPGLSGNDKVIFAVSACLRSPTGSDQGLLLSTQPRFNQNRKQVSAVRTPFWFMLLKNKGTVPKHRCMPFSSEQIIETVEISARVERREDPMRVQWSGRILCWSVQINA